MWNLWFKIKIIIIRERKCCQTRRIFGTTYMWTRYWFCYKQRTPKVVNNGIVLLDSKTNIKKLVGVPSCYFAHVRLRWEQLRKLRLTYTSLSFLFLISLIWTSVRRFSLSGENCQFQFLGQVLRIALVLFLKTILILRTASVFRILKKIRWGNFQG